jgi:hypothetical protein
VPVFGSGGVAVAALELTVPNLRTDLQMASSVLTIAARGLSRELTASNHSGCFAQITEQHAPNRTVLQAPDQERSVAMSARGLFSGCRQRRRHAATGKYYFN